MGQQQVLLVLLVVVIAGIATVIAINTMETVNQRNNTESIKVHLLKINNLAQTYYKKHASMGGGGGSFLNIKEQDILMDSVTVQGSYSLSNVSDQSFTITVVPVSGAETIEAVYTSDGVTFN